MKCLLVPSASRCFLSPFCRHLFHSQFSTSSLRHASSSQRSCYRFLHYRCIPMSSKSYSQTQAVTPSADVSAHADIFSEIQAHQESAPRLSPVDEVRTFIDGSSRAMLSTFSLRYRGYPTGAMVDFACDSNGTPILAVSNLSAHTKDLLDNPKCSLLVARDPEDKTDLVVTLHGDAIMVSEEDKAVTRNTYLKKHPNAYWVDFGDFQFIRIELHAVRYVSGVATALLRSGEFDKDEYKAAKVDPISQFSKPIMSHMNKDHAADTKLLVQHVTSVSVDFPEIVDVDSLGFNVKASYKGTILKLRIPFPRHATERKDVKTLIVDMLQDAKNA